MLVSHPDIQRLRVRMPDGEERTAILYDRYTPRARPGDRIVVNTTAVDLDLGSGGDDYVVWNLAHETHESPSGGHIVKLRYTPAQSDVLAVEAPESPHHQAMAASGGLGGLPVVAASLHSQVLPVVCGLRTVNPGARVAYVMTDGAALEVGFSNTVRRLRELGWLCGSVSVGHAMGGDLEAVNVYSGLLASAAVLGADIAVAGMGPGVVGTATPFGTTALELGQTINAAAALGGRPVACVRMSDTDPRDRHRGVSHHSLIALGHVALARAAVPVPLGFGDDFAEVADAHDVVEVQADAVVEALREAEGEGLRPSHMGRGLDADRLFFLAAGAAGIHAAALLE